MAVLKSGTTIGGRDVMAEVDNKLSVVGGVITGNLTLKGSGNYGNKVNFGDGDYVHISEPTDDKMELKGKDINMVVANAGGLKLNGTSLIGSGTADLTAGSSSLTTGCLYCVYE